MTSRTTILYISMAIAVAEFTSGYATETLTGIFNSTSTRNYTEHGSSTAPFLPASTKQRRGEYPPEVFTIAQRKKGAVALHIIGMCYMFVALAIVCDEFFIPALTVMIEKWKISENVAGATFMAAGGSAPELFTSILGLFAARNDVGIGTIVGSAVFNILFVIGMCAIFSRQVLTLTWWPLFRDVCFYAVALVQLMVFFNDRIILWWEALILFSWFLTYATFMKFNDQVERRVKLFVNSSSPKNDGTANAPETNHNSSATLANMHQSVFHVMLHTNVLKTETQHNSQDIMHGVASLGSMVASVGELGKRRRASSKGNISSDMRLASIPSLSAPSPPPDEALKTISETVPTNHVENDHYDQETEIRERALSAGSRLSIRKLAKDRRTSKGSSSLTSSGIISTSVDDTLDIDEEPLSLQWPDTVKKRITYVIIYPILITLWLTLPDVRNPHKKKWFLVTFLGSIIWIGCYSYLMIWWANETGETFGISPAIMGITVLAAGTSIPDLITSVLVARRGYGDMAVSSSVGSNIFDITVGLPVPWLAWCIIMSKPVSVISKGLFCSIFILFVMLMLIVMTIALFKWRMSRWLGFCMFALYGVFLGACVTIESDILPCPIVS